MTSFLMTSLLCQVCLCMYNNFFMTIFCLTSLICSSVHVPVQNFTLTSLLCLPTDEQVFTFLSALLEKHGKVARIDEKKKNLAYENLSLKTSSSVRGFTVACPSIYL